MKLPKNLGLLVFIFLVLISLALITYPEIMRPTGVIVTSVGTNTPCGDIISVGSTITGVGNKLVINSNDFSELTEELEGVVTFLINGNPRSCNIPKGMKLNVSVADKKTEGIKLGTDIWGGIYYLFKTQEFSQNLIDHIEQRLIKYELSNTKIEPYNKTLIKITTDSDEENYVSFLVEKGKLNGKITQTIDFTKKTVEFLFNDKTYEMFLNDEKSVEINGSVYKVGQYFELEGVDLVVENISKNMTTISAIIFQDNNLNLIQNSRIVRQSGGYLFAVPVELSEVASENLEKTTKNLEVLINPSTGESYSKFPLSVLIDDEPFISVPILSSDMGTKKDNLILWSFSPTIEGATKNMVRLKTIIETKSLSQELTLVKRDVFKSSFGEVLITSFLWVILGASVITSLLFFIRFHKNSVVSLPLILLVLSGIVLTLGVVSTQWFSLIIFFSGASLVFLRGEIRNWKCWVGILLFLILIAGFSMKKWVLNIPMIIGLVATTLVGFGQGIYIGMKILKKGNSYVPSDYKNMSTKLWLLSSIFSVILLLLYFVSEILLGFLMAFSIGLWINMSLVLPVYAGITKKVIK